MIPTSLLGLVLFLALLSPGFVYLQARERRHPGIDYSVLRETSLVVVTSALGLLMALSLASVARYVAPSSTPDVGAYVRGGSTYLKEHYAEAFLWAVALVTVACGFAFLLAVPPAICARGRLRNWVIERRGSGVIEQKSGWSAAFDAHRDHRKILEVVLNDGTTLFGALGSRSTQLEETEDRDLVLAAPIKVRERGAQWVDLPTAGTVVVSASRIKYLVVSYEPALRPTKSRRPRRH